MTTPKRLAAAALAHLALAVAGSLVLAAPRAAAAGAAPLQTTPAADVLAAVTLANNEVDIDFPTRLTFSVDLNGAEAVTRVILEYGAEQQTCGTVVAKAFPEYTPGADGRVAWTWEMLQSGSQPPGAQVWWRWRLLDASGAARVTETQTATWLDDQHAWKTRASDGVSLHWYSGSDAFAEALHQAALTALDDLAVTPGLSFDGDVNLYIYGDSDALQEAVLYEPGWTGGLAYPEHSIVLIGVSPDNLEWGQHTVAHELTHVLVGHFTFSCLGFVPTWLNEGLAVYGEGGPDAGWVDRLDRAIADDSLIPVAALNGGFSEDPGQADLSYVESFSLVNFLMETHGSARMLDLLGRLRDGSTVEAALVASYGFGLDGLEQGWRASIGARPPAVAAVTATPAPAATIVPTIVPLDGIPVGPTVAPTRVRAAATATLPPRAVDPGLPPRAGTAFGVGLVLVCLAALCLGAGALGVGALALSRRGRQP